MTTSARTILFPVSDVAAAKAIYTELLGTVPAVDDLRDADGNVFGLLQDPA